MGTITYLKDTLVNFVSGMGTARDKAASTQHMLIQYTDQELLNIYRSSWLARKIIDIPAFDSFRKWRDWQGKEDIIGLIEAEENRLNLRGKYLEASIKARLFGGSGIFIGTGDTDPSQPLDVERITKGGVKYLHVLLARHLTPGELIRDVMDPFYGRPEHYTLSTGPTASVTGQVTIHPSRIIPFHGEPLADDELAVTSAGRGWGADSVLLSRMAAINQAEATAANIASLVFEAKVDVIKIPDLMASLVSPAYRDRLLDRFALASQGKGLNGVLMLDSEEEYSQKSASFATLPDVLMAFMQIVSGAADIPATRLLGQSPAGMNATGESDLRNYYDNIQAMQTVEITPTIHPLDEAIIRSALGNRPPELHYIWSSLWQVSDKERADIGKLDADTIVALNGTGLFPPEALANAAANMLVEHSIMPGLLEEIEAAGGLPDYELEAENDNAAKLAEAEARAAPAKRVAANDAEPKSLYVRRDVLNHSEIRDHYTAQGLDVTVENLHVTIIHSDFPVDWFAVGDAWDERIELPAGGARDHELFGPPGLEDSLVLMISSRSLKWRHEEFKEHGARSSFEEYQPHITLRYKDGGASQLDGLDPYIGRIVLGPEIFEEVD